MISISTLPLPKKGKESPVWQMISSGASRVLFYTVSTIQIKCVLVAQSCPTLRTLPGFSVHGILQVKILEWIAIPFSRGSSRPRDWTLVSWIAGRFFTICATGSPTNKILVMQRDRKIWLRKEKKNYSRPNGDLNIEVSRKAL